MADDEAKFWSPPDPLSDVAPLLLPHALPLLPELPLLPHELPPLLLDVPLLPHELPPLLLDEPLLLPQELPLLEPLPPELVHASAAPESSGAPASCGVTNVQ